jgi:hypothetical protein
VDDLRVNSDGTLSAIGEIAAASCVEGIVAS